MVKITADSTCDLSPAILKELNITLSPLHILAWDKEYRDGVDITPGDVFDFAERQGIMCRTAAVNVYEYEHLFEGFSAGFDAVVHICIGSGFSACYQNAVLAAARFQNVFVVDSRNLSSGSGHIVYEAALMAKSGAGAEEILKGLKTLIPRVDASFVIDRLDYLHKGGRCSGLEAAGAKLLQIKPCIEVLDGQMKVGKKYRGSFERCLESYIKDKLSDLSQINLKRVFITHPMCSTQTVQRVREAVSRYAGFEEVIETKAGCTISSHCGPKTLGILFLRNSGKQA
jgi:DegV family protein with EDD domain